MTDIMADIYGAVQNAQEVAYEVLINAKGVLIIMEQKEPTGPAEEHIWNIIMEDTFHISKQLGWVPEDEKCRIQQMAFTLSRETAQMIVKIRTKEEKLTPSEASQLENRILKNEENIIRYICSGQIADTLKEMGYGKQE